MLYIANERENNLLCSEEQQFTAALSCELLPHISWANNGAYLPYLEANCVGHLASLIFQSVAVTFISSAITELRREAYRPAIIEINSIKTHLQDNLQHFTVPLKLQRISSVLFIKFFIHHVCSESEYQRLYQHGFQYKENNGKSEWQLKRGIKICIFKSHCVLNNENS